MERLKQRQKRKELGCATNGDWEMIARVDSTSYLMQLYLPGMYFYFLLFLKFSTLDSSEDENKHEWSLLHINWLNCFYSLWLGSIS